MTEQLLLSHWGICAGEEEEGRIFLATTFEHILPCDVPSLQSALFYSNIGSTAACQFPGLIIDLLSMRAHLFPWKWGNGTAQELYNKAITKFWPKPLSESILGHFQPPTWWRLLSTAFLSSWIVAPVLILSKPSISQEHTETKQEHDKQTCSHMQT